MGCKMQLYNLHENYSLFLKGFHLDWKLPNCSFQRVASESTRKKTKVVNPELLYCAVQLRPAQLGNHGEEDAVVKMLYRHQLFC